MTDTLNEKQKEAVTLLNNFLISTDRFFILKGSAGVGKSYVLKSINLPRTAVTATTNKAASVIGNGAVTIYSYLGISVFKEELRFPRFPKPIDNVIIIDEASMLSEELFNYIEDTYPRSKFILVGDPFQLPNVNGTFNVFDKPFPYVELTEPMRAKHNDLVNMLVQLRESVREGKSSFIFHSDNIHYITQDDMVRGIDKLFIQEQTDSVILAFTNSKVDTYNAYIREKQGRHPVIFSPGEFAISNTFTTGNTNHKLVTDETYYISDVDTTNNNLFEFANYSVCIDNFWFTVPLDYAEFRNYLNELYRKKDLDKYYHLKETIAYLKPSYALTIHKSQGSSYDNVFIDLNSFDRCFDLDLGRRLLYVALTRAKNKIYLYGSLPNRLKG